MMLEGRVMVGQLIKDPILPVKVILPQPIVWKSIVQQSKPTAKIWQCSSDKVLCSSHIVNKAHCEALQQIGQVISGTKVENVIAKESAKHFLRAYTCMAIVLCGHRGAQYTAEKGHNLEL